MTEVYSFFGALFLGGQRGLKLPISTEGERGGRESTRCNTALGFLHGPMQIEAKAGNVAGV